MRRAWDLVTRVRAPHRRHPCGPKRQAAPRRRTAPPFYHARNARVKAEPGDGGMAGMGESARGNASAALPLAAR
ncbi:MAG: hypothetical protein U1B94_00675 [candidate division NC10 bacterium]|nr:hypothetical protein [candidate division NC10 bacterium]